MNTLKTNRIEIRNDGWGDAIVENILAVLTSSIDIFEKNIQTERFNSKIVLVQNSSFHVPPIEHPIMYKLDPKNSIYLNVQDRLWSKYAYQFAHEYCHHQIESDLKNTFDQFGWFEESLCELASIHSIKDMANAWTSNPPYLNWVSYAESLNEYTDEIINRETNKIEDSFSYWLKENIDELSKNRYNREKNCLIAKNISDIFFNDPYLWNSISFINEIEVSKEMKFSEFMDLWGSIVPENNKKSWDILKERLIN